MPRFDTLIMVDWSAAAVPKTGADSIWIAWLDRDRLGRGRGITLENPATRLQARERLETLIGTRITRGRRVLAGFDFPFGYPAGTAAALGLMGAPGPAPWERMWRHISERITDDADNRNNRFAVAADMNRAMTGTAFPFWGCPVKAQTPLLGMRRLRPHGPADLPERRRADRATPGAQPVWKLFTTGSVGSQILMGLPVLDHLRRALVAQGRVQVWPFETGLTLPPPPPSGGEAILAEIYPSLWLRKAPEGAIKDALQVKAVVEDLAQRDRKASLAPLFEGPSRLSAPARRAICEEEAWIVGVDHYSE